MKPLVWVTFADPVPGLRARVARRPRRDVDGILCLLTDRIDLTRFPKLRAVANVAVGYDNIDVAEARRRGIVVTNTPGVLTEATADLAFGLMLAAARRIVEGDRFMRSGKFRGWGFHMLRGTEVHGKRLAIVGMGRIGKAVARRARGFGMRVTTDWRRADFVSIHVPLTARTRHMIDPFAMKRGAILVNTARGPVVQERRLIRALNSGHLSAAGVDVYEFEPRTALTRLPNVVCAPHIGSATEETRQAMLRLAIRNLNAALAGRNPPNRV